MLTASENSRIHTDINILLSTKIPSKLSSSSLTPHTLQAQLITVDYYLHMVEVFDKINEKTSKSVLTSNRCEHMVLLESGCILRNILFLKLCFSIKSEPSWRASCRPDLEPDGDWIQLRSFRMAGPILRARYYLTSQRDPSLEVKVLSSHSRLLPITSRF